MRNLILASHGELAAGVKNSVEMLAGEQKHLYIVSLKPDGDNLQFEQDLVTVVNSLKGSVMILVDLLGGTPCNVILKHYLADERVKIITGLSVPLTLSYILGNESVPDLIEAGQEAIIDAKEQMKQLMNDNEEDE